MPIPDDPTLTRHFPGLRVNFEFTNLIPTSNFRRYSLNAVMRRKSKSRGVCYFQDASKFQQVSRKLFLKYNFHFLRQNSRSRAYPRWYTYISFLIYISGFSIYRWLYIRKVGIGGIFEIQPMSISENPKYPKYQHLVFRKMPPLFQDC